LSYASADIDPLLCDSEEFALLHAST